MSTERDKILEAFKMAQDEELTEDFFNKGLDGNKYLDTGVHDVTIKEATLGTTMNNVPFLQLVFEDEAGLTARQRVYLMDKEGKMGYQAKLLVRGLFTEFNDKLAFKKAADADPFLWEALVGIKVNITIEEGKRGYTIKEGEIGNIIVDVKSGEQLFPDKEFESFSDAKEYVALWNEENPEAMLYRAWPEVTKYEVIEGEEETNEQLLLSVRKTETPKAPTAPRGKLRPPSKTL